MWSCPQVPGCSPPTSDGPNEPTTTPFSSPHPKRPVTVFPPFVVTEQYTVDDDYTPNSPTSGKDLERPMDRLSPISYLVPAQQYLEAAEWVFHQPNQSFSIPGYFLAALALELAIKSFLLFRGNTEHELKEIGHDLSRGLDAASQQGLCGFVDLQREHLAVITQLNWYYVSKDLEHVTTGYKSYPNQRILIDTLQHLIDTITPVIHTWKPVE